MILKNKHYYKALFYILLFRRLKHRLGFHNKECRRRIYTTEQDYLCLVTGNSHKKFTI